MSKKIILSIIIIILIIIIGYIFYISNKKKIDISDLKVFRFSYSTGYAINSNVRYYVDIEDGKYIATIKPNEIPDDDEFKIEISDKEINKIKEILLKNKVSKWNGFDKVDRFVLDGNSFSLYIRFTNDKTIEASGYMKWPNNYYEVRNSFDKLFMELYNNK